MAHSARIDTYTENQDGSIEVGLTLAESVNSPAQPSGITLTFTDALDMETKCAQSEAIVAAELPMILIVSPPLLLNLPLMQR